MQTTGRCSSTPLRWCQKRTLRTVFSLTLSPLTPQFQWRSYGEPGLLPQPKSIPHWGGVRRDPTESQYFHPCRVVIKLPPPWCWWKSGLPFPPSNNKELPALGVSEGQEENLVFSLYLAVSRQHPPFLGRAVSKKQTAEQVLIKSRIS